MKKELILKIGTIAIMGGVMFGLTGCTSKITVETDGTEDINIQTNIVQKDKEESNTIKVESNKEQIKVSEIEKTETEKVTNSGKNENLTKQEITEIEEFINNINELNTGFLFVNYDNPEDLTKKLADEAVPQLLGPTSINLRYAIIHSGYGRKAKTGDIIKIYNTKESNGTTCILTEQDLIDFFKEKINYEYTEERIKHDFKEYYKESVNGYVFNASDSFYEELHIKNGYKIGNKYYLKFEFVDPVYETDETINLVLEKQTGYYTFYSCENSAINRVKTDKDINQNDSEQIVRELFSKYIEEMSMKPNYEIKDYTINKVEIVSYEYIKRGYFALDDIEKYYPNVTKSDIFAIVTYSIEMDGDIDKNYWIAGNGEEIDGNWIKNKVANIYLVEENGEYVIKGNGTDW